MQTRNELTQAFELVEKLFKNITDKGGQPYLNHLTQVASKVNNKSAKTIALLHDVIEDTDITADDLKSMGFSPEVIDGVVVLTRLPDEQYTQYINRIVASNHLNAMLVKLADLEHNMDINRICSPTQKDIDRVEKRYKPAYKLVSKKVNNLKQSKNNKRS